MTERHLSIEGNDEVVDLGNIGALTEATHPENALPSSKPVGEIDPSVLNQERGYPLKNKPEYK